VVLELSGTNTVHACPGRPSGNLANTKPLTENSPNLLAGRGGSADPVVREGVENPIARWRVRNRKQQYFALLSESFGGQLISFGFREP
jgi:shikimate 5-dehydrogenase